MSGQQLSNKFLNVSHSSVLELMNDDSLRVYINDYAYTAITHRNVSLKVGVTSITCEDGLNRSDNAYAEPTDMSFTIVTSKLDPTEYNMLRELYKNRTIIPFHSMYFSCNNAIITSFEISDEYLDVLVIDINIHEILVSDSDIIPEFNSNLIQTTTESCTINSNPSIIATDVTSESIMSNTFGIAVMMAIAGPLAAIFLPAAITAHAGNRNNNQSEREENLLESFESCS